MLLSGIAYLLLIVPLSLCSSFLVSFQGRTGTENRPGQFPTTTLPAQPNFHSTGPTLAKSKKSPVFHTKITFYIIHSFILNICIAPLQQNYSEALPTPARLKRAVLR